MSSCLQGLLFHPGLRWSWGQGHLPQKRHHRHRLSVKPEEKFVQTLFCKFVQCHFLKVPWRLKRFHTYNKRNFPAVTGEVYTPQQFAVLKTDKHCSYLWASVWRPRVSSAFSASTGRSRAGGAGSRAGTGCPRSSGTSSSASRRTARSRTRETSVTERQDSASERGCSVNLQRWSEVHNQQIVVLLESVLLAQRFWIIRWFKTVELFTIKREHNKFFVWKRK